MNTACPYCGLDWEEGEVFPSEKVYGRPRHLACGSERYVERCAIPFPHDFPRFKQSPACKKIVELKAFHSGDIEELEQEAKRHCRTIRALQEENARLGSAPLDHNSCSDLEDIKRLLRSINGKLTRC